jgi:ribonuclease Z
MNIILLGTGAAWPDADRSAPAFLVEIDEKKLLVDCGGGVSHQLMKAGIAPSSLETVLFTHMHIDHCVEFPSLVFGAYLTGKEGSFAVYGPEGTEHFTTSVFADTYDFARPMMKKLRNMDIAVVTTEVREGRLIAGEGYSVEAAPMEHGFPTVAYRFRSSEGKTLVISGDTAPCDALVEFARDADLLVIECSFRDGGGAKPGHCIPSQVADVCTRSGVKSAVLVHLFPSCKGHEEEILADVRKGYNGEVRIGKDLDRIAV